MENTNNTTKAIGILLITGAIALLIPYTILAIIFDYPVILREETVVVPTWFYAASLQSSDGIIGAYRIDVAQVSDRFGAGPFRSVQVAA